MLVGTGCIIREPYTRNLDTLTKPQAQADLDYLQTQIVAIHPKPGCPEPPSLDERVTQIKEGLADSVSREDLRLHVSEILASLHDSHSTTFMLGSFFSYTSSGKPAFPLLLRANSDGMTILDVAEGVDNPALEVGATITAIDGQPMPTLIDRYERYACAETHSQRLVILEMLLPAMLWRDNGPADSYDITLKSKDGSTKTVAVPASTYRFASLKPNPNNEPFPHEFYDNDRACMLHAETFNGNQAEAFRTKLDVVFGELKERNCNVLIVDVRRNAGGSTSLPFDLLRRVAKEPIRSGQKNWRYSNAYCQAMKVSGLHQRKISSIWLFDCILPLQWFNPVDRSRFEADGEWLRSKPSTIAPYETHWPGRLVVLTDRWSASAAVDLASLAQDNKLAAIAGEETGGRASYCGEIATLLLPNSGITAQVSSSIWTRASGVQDDRGVIPDIPVNPELDNATIVRTIMDSLPATSMQTDPA